MVQARKKVYIAGKITGLKDYQNKFWVAKMILERQGHLVMNPAVLPAGFDYEDYMRICFAMIEVCDAVYMLDNWRDSPGAMREHEYAGAAGKAIMYAHVDSIVKHKKVKFLDNNILALPEHKEILAEIVQKGIKCQFNQGLDIRLLDSENSVLLSKINYLGEYIFAFDNWECKTLIEKKMFFLSWRKPYQLKFFVYIHPDMPLAETIKRIVWLKEKQCLPYIMRDISCWKSENSDFFVDLSAYCNQVHLFKKMEFTEFLEKRHKNKNRIVKSKRLWNENL